MQQENIIETKICEQCNSSFEITDKDLVFYDKMSPVIEGKKYNLPFTDICFSCEEQKRLSWINVRKLYKRNCDLSGKTIISIFSPDKPYKVYDYKEWDSDKWDPLDYGFDFDFNRGFFEQFDELLKKVPFKSLFITDSENCDYNNLIENSKNCYYCFQNSDSEDTSFCDSSKFVYDSLEVSWSLDIKNSYEILDGVNSYKCYYCFLCSGTNDSYFCLNCNNCDFCFLCSGLLNKKYCILNKQYTKEEYEIEIKKFLSKPDFVNYCFNEFNKLNLQVIKRNFDASNNDNCLGNNIYNSKNCINCFNVVNGEDIRYLAEGGRTNNVYDSNVVYQGNGYIYNSLSVFDSSKVICSNLIFSSYNIFYSYYLQNCSNCFGCIGLKNKKFCIFNKQYSLKEYEELVPKLIEFMQNINEWGKFFPSNISTFGYNETLAMEYYPVTSPLISQKQPHPDPLLRGEGGRFKWSDYEAPFPKVEKIIPGEKLPNDISKIPDDILNWAIECEVTKKLFRITMQELEFYRKHNLPIPKRHPDQRYFDRMSFRNPRKIYDRKCAKCGKDMKTTYSPEKKDIIYCEECYNREIY